MKIKAKLIGLGRQKFTGVVNFTSWRGLMNHIRTHVMSKSVEIMAEEGSKKGRIVVGGFRMVGGIELMDGVFKVVQDETLMVMPDGK